MSLSVLTRTTVGHLEFNQKDFLDNYPNRGFKILHDLCGRREFELPRLVELARRLPDSYVEYYAGQVPVNQDVNNYPKNGLSVVETVQRIEKCGSWMVLKDVEMDIPYSDLLRGLLNEVEQQIDPSMRGMHRTKAFVFISSPNSVTPYHLDDEHNFLLQIRGCKWVSMWDPKDRTVVPEAQAEYMMERHHNTDWQRYMPFDLRFQERATVFELNAGEGLHFPFGAPHWVKNGPEVSISFSITYLSEMSERQAALYSLNRRMRKMGLEPTPPEGSAWRDSLKYGAVRAARRTKKVLKRLPFEPKPGSGVE
jgi:hypothetical protein